MTFVVLAPLLAALAAATLTWRQATRLDRRSFHMGKGDDQNESSQWTFVLGGLIAAVLAVTVLQLNLLEGLRFGTQ